MTSTWGLHVLYERSTHCLDHKEAFSAQSKSTDATGTFTVDGVLWSFTPDTQGGFGVETKTATEKGT